MIPKVVSWKKDTVKDLVDLLKSGDTIAVIDVHGVPAGAMLGMRASLRSDMKIQVAKKRLMSIAWERAGFEDSNLNEMFEGAIQPALVSSSNLNSFELFTELKKTEAGRAAKEGDVAPHQIVVEKMDTGMPPGPIVGDLNSVGIPAKIMGGSVQIQKRTVVLEAGDVFEGDMGMMLSKIGINPIVTGLRLCGTLEGGTLFAPSTLDIDYEQFETDLISYAAGAFNLACNITWFTSQTMPTILAKASREAMAVALEAAITTAETMPHLVGRAHNGAMAVAGQLDSDALDEELANMLGAAASAAASAASSSDSTSEVPTEAEEEEEEEEEESFGGLGDLFG
ncbi:50S ribosomal protein L10 [Euryarchaeota archaeon]|nr:50S ribosomal protein L10 [Euryarchaeota archaeon]MDA8700465.1 50S ribosomal protein L10 [Euryarchaeota archaeon]MDA9828817.1 50S ribosomal protein L10 [Candidatus Poseidoniaceae archaeon]MDC3235941.1 50S ribosomal protein L10 [Candidatus Poseidoniaceae archaeon]